MRPIRRLVGLQIETPAFKESIDFYTRGFGLTLSTHANDKLAIFAGARGAAGVLEIRKSHRAGLIGLTFAVATADDLRRSRDELKSSGLTIREDHSVDSAAGFFAIDDTDGRRLTFVVDEGQPDGKPTEDGRPLYISHVVLNSPQPDRLTSLFVDTLGFKVADRYEKNLLTFLRCAQPQHHCIGVSPGDAASLNHFSLDVGSIDALMRSIGRMQKSGLKPAWGPGRHGPGGNVLCYFEDPTGFVAEFTCDVIQITDEHAWVPKEWPRVPDTANVWGTGGPSPRAVELMSGHR